MRPASTVRLASALMQLGTALCLLPVVAVLLLRTGSLLPLLPWGAGVAVLGIVLGLSARD